MFWKFQANGNDFILMESMEDLDVVRLCDRHFGIGADGLLLVHHDGETVHYRHFNADGSEADLCVNGIRCVAAWYFSCFGKQHVRIEIADCNYDLYLLENDEVLLELPHPMILGENIYQTGVIHEIVDQFEDLYPQDRNYDIVQVIDDSCVEVKTWERGAGLTLSCGSGMISSYYHCFCQGLVKAKGAVQSAGGEAKIEIKPDKILFSSKVSCVFRGCYLLN